MHPRKCILLPVMFVLESICAAEIGQKNSISFGRNLGIDQLTGVAPQPITEAVSKKPRWSENVDGKFPCPRVARRLLWSKATLVHELVSSSKRVCSVR